jgi:4-hydroxy-tetrahydrodipicolinate reductase
MTRVGVFGAGGRMGVTVCRAVAGAPGLDLVAAVDPYHLGVDLRQVAGIDGGLQVQGDAQAFLAAGVEVAVDFTLVEAARENLRWCAENGVHAVVGTTGFSDDEHAEFERVFTKSNCVIAPNFAIGAVLMMRFAELAAPYFETAEIIELHHNAKIDAPSGTARATAERMAAASSDWAADPTEDEVVPGARGGKGPGGIPIHAVRMQGMFAHQEVVMGTTGQTLSIRHDTFDRDCYMPGVLLAIKAVQERAGVTYGLDKLLDI